MIDPEQQTKTFSSGLIHVAAIVFAIWTSVELIAQQGLYRRNSRRAAKDVSIFRDMTFLRQAARRTRISLSGLFRPRTERPLGAISLTNSPGLAPGAFSLAGPYFTAPGLRAAGDVSSFRILRFNKATTSFTSLPKS